MARATGRDGWRARVAERVSTAPTGGGSLSLRRDIGVTAAAQIGVAVGGLLLYRLIAIHKGAPGVATYALLKQIVVFGISVVILGMQTAIPRYVALCREQDERPESFLVAAVACTTVATTLVCAALLVAPQWAASLLFGNSHRTYLLVPLAGTLVASLAVEITAGYFRGLFDFKVAAALRVVGSGAWPVVLLVAVPGKSMATLILLMAVGLAALCAVALAVPVARGLLSDARQQVPGAARTLLNYGSRRVPGDLSAVALWSVTPVVAAHFVSLKQLAYLGAGIQVLNVVSMGFQSIGLIFLPVMARLWLANQERARWFAGQLSAAAIHLALFTTPQILLFADVAVRAWLGRSFNDASSIIRLTLMPVAFYICSIVLRSPLDAASVRGYNSRNRVAGVACAVAVGALLLGLHIGTRIEAITIAFSAGLILVGILTFLTVRRVYSISHTPLAIAPALSLATMAAAIAAVTRFLIIGSSKSLVAMVLVLVLEAALTAGFIAGLSRSGVAWPAEFRERMLRRRAAPSASD